MRFVHLLLLPLWASAALVTARNVAAELHYETANLCPDDPKRHVAELERAIALNPVQGLARAELGRAHAGYASNAMAQGNYQTALEEFKRAAETTREAMRFEFSLTTAKQLASALHQTGYIYFLANQSKPSHSRQANQTKHYEEALKEYEDVLAFLPNDQEALYRAALINMPYHLGRPEQAKALARRYLEFHDPAPEIYYVLGWVLQDLHRERQGMHYFHRFLLRGKGDVLPVELRENYDWTDHLSRWIQFIRQVETGKITVAPPPPV